MEWTVSFPIGARFFERNIFTNYLHNIQPIFDGLNVGHTWLDYHSRGKNSNRNRLTKPLKKRKVALKGRCAMFTDNLDMDKVREFYEPHPGPNENEKMSFTFPNEVKEAAGSLNGRKVSVRHALAIITAATDNGKDGTAFIKEEEKYIGLHIHIGGRFDASHQFKVIKWR